MNNFDNLIVNKDIIVGHDNSILANTINHAELWGNETTTLINSSLIVPVPMRVLSEEFNSSKIILQALLDMISRLIKDDHTSVDFSSFIKHANITDSTGKIIYNLVQQDFGLLDFQCLVLLRAPKLTNNSAAQHEKGEN